MRTPPTKTTSLLAVSLLILWAPISACAAEPNAGSDLLRARPEVVQAWKEMRLGMFVCWGPVSLTGEEVGWSRQAPRTGSRNVPWGGQGKTPKDVYDNLYKKWKPDDRIKTFKECIEILVRCAGGDGNLALNTNPMPDGRIEPRQVERFRQIGAWLKQNGQSVYGTRGGPYRPTQEIGSTRKGNTVYIHVLHWSGDTIALPKLPRKVLGASLLTGGTVDVKEDDRVLTIHVPAQARQEIDTIVKLDLDGPALDIPPLPAPVEKK